MWKNGQSEVKWKRGEDLQAGRVENHRLTAGCAIMARSNQLRDSEVRQALCGWHAQTCNEVGHGESVYKGPKAM